MAISKTLNVNGERITTAVDDPDMPLLYLLRGNLGLHGPRFGCGLAQCGACTVHVDGKAVRSCVAAIVLGRRRQQGRDAGRIGHAGETASVAARLYPGTGFAVRLLHQRHDHGGGGFPHHKPKAKRSRHQECACRKSVPMRHACPHRERGQARSRRGSREAVMSKPFIPSRRDFLKTGGALVVGFSLAGQLQRRIRARNCRN